MFLCSLFGGELPRIEVSPDGRSFIEAGTETRFIPFGFNYDHDADGRLLEDYWEDEWAEVVEDFGEMKKLGANVVRIHLQLGEFMDSAKIVSPKALVMLGRLLDLAAETGLYLDLTGLGCYHAAEVPEWYDLLPEAERWEVQARFWKAVAKAAVDRPQVFCYDLMNEPILPPAEGAETTWLAGELGGKFYVQRIALDAAGRERTEIAAAWVATLCSAIREADSSTLITVGVIPWAVSFPAAKPLFYSPEVSKPLDFVSIHMYPRRGKLEQDLTALRTYEIGKPLVVEEIFPLHCDLPELATFVSRSCEEVDGWIGFYWGKTPEEYQHEADISSAITRGWLGFFRENAERIKSGHPPHQEK